MMKRVWSLVLVLAMVLGIFAVIPVQAFAASELKASDSLLSYLKVIEGFRATPYWDHSQWTVGFGSRCPDEDLERYKKEGIPMEEAHALLASKANGYGNTINAFADRNGLTLSQQQFDALISFTYNLGSAWMSNKNSTMYKAVVGGYTGNDFIAAISAYCNASGEYLPGLMKRRLSEASMYLDGTYSRYAPGNYCNVRYDGNGGDVTANAQGYDCNLYAVPTSKATYSGYSFQGWYTEKTGGVRITQLDETTDGMTLYAHWVQGTEGGTDLPEDGVKVTVTGSRVNVRMGPGLSYSIVGSVIKGEKLVITKTKEVGGLLWGKFSEGWLALSYTNYEEVTTPDDPGTTKPPATEKPDETLPQLPSDATVVGTDALSVYNGPHTTYPKVGTLKAGQVITILEIYDMFGDKWGRTEKGWVKLDDNLIFENYPLLAHSFVATVTSSTVNVRSGPGTNYTKLGAAKKGEKLTVAVVVVASDGSIWGKHQNGWSCLDGYTDLDESKIPQYKAHSYGDWYDSKAPTCAAKGEQRRDCKHCDHFEIRYTELADHTYGKWQVSEPGTCVVPGKEQRKCGVCAKTETRTGELGEHGLGQWQTVTAATCTAEGEERRNCQYCEYFETQKTALADHTYGAWVVVLEPTTTEVGQERRNCTVCEHFEIRELPVSEHSFSEWTVVKAPTCTENGEASRSCSHCELVETQQLPASGHIYSQWAQLQAPTCQEAGLEVRVCTVCEESEKRIVDALEHSFSQWKVTAEPSCDKEGEEASICTICETIQTRPIAKTEHIHTQWLLVIKPTCSQPGVEISECSRCNAQIKREVATTEHVYGDWELTKVPTCAEYGEARRVCTVCNAYEAREVSKIGHSYGPWEIVTAATCSAAGQERRSCANCDEIETRETEKGDHSYGQWVVAVEPSCAATGEARRSCTVCEQYESRVLPQLSHVYSAWVTTQAASCAAAGESVRICENCNNVEKTEIPKLDHSFGQWQVTKAPTTTEEGQQRRDCENCDHYETKSIPCVDDTVAKKVYATITCNALTIRKGPGTSYGRVSLIYKGAKVEILEQTVVGSVTWGKIENGWICLTGYTSLEVVEEEEPKEEIPVEKVYATITCSALTIRTGPGTSYGRVALIYKGAKVEILEQKVVGSVVWGKIERGWICLTGYATLETVKEDDSFVEKPGQTVTKTYATVSCSALTLREGAGTGYAKLGLLRRGSTVEILEQLMVGSAMWGRTENGWICLTGYTTLETKEETV